MEEACGTIGLGFFVPDPNGSVRLYGQAAGRPLCQQVLVVGPDGRFHRPAQQPDDGNCEYRFIVFAWDFH